MALSGRPAHNRKIDYERAVALRSKGFTMVQIAKELGVNLGTLRVGFSRKGITQLLASVENCGLSKTLKDKALGLREHVGAAVTRDLSYLSTLAPASCGAEVAVRYTPIEPAVRIASKVFGWDNEKPGAMHLSLSSVKHYHGGEASSESGQLGDAAPILDRIIDVPDKD